MLVCPACFSVKGLQTRIEEIRKTASTGACEFHPTRKGIPIEAVAAIIDPVFRENYGGGIYDSRYDEITGNSLNDVLYEVTGAERDEVVVGLANHLIEEDPYWPGDGEGPFYSEDLGYVRDRYSLGEHGRLWARFRESLLYEQRFFNAEARELIEHIFRHVHQQRDDQSQGPVYLIRPGDEQASFFRARVADDEPERAKITKDLVAELGPPPERLRRPGRLNPSGVSCFYGAFDLDTCVAELRPSVGSFIVGARFEITEAICVLDTTRFDAKPKEPNLYAKGAMERAAQWRFMQTFMREIGQPILPVAEHLDYVPTQAVAEYLAQHHTFSFAGQERTIDAIIYASAQRPGGKNIALLGAASVVGAEATIAAPQKDVEEDGLPFWTSHERAAPRVRLVPIADNLEKRSVRGVAFTTRSHLDPGDNGVPMLDAEGYDLERE